jgi:SET domain-containing protein
LEPRFTPLFDPPPSLAVVAKSDGDDAAADPSGRLPDGSLSLGAIAAEVARMHTSVVQNLPQSNTKYRHASFVDDSGSLSVRRSGIHSLGLFAAKPIASESIVVEYVGEVVREPVVRMREAILKEEGEGSSYYFGIDRMCFIDATKAGNKARYINHSCAPNCYGEIVQDGPIKKVVMVSDHCSSRKIDTRASDTMPERIRTGEEITYGYNFGIELEETKVPCLCGAPNCAGYLNYREH